MFPFHVLIIFFFFFCLFFVDISSLSYQTVVVRAGQNVNISCPGVNELSLVSDLEWRCQGCGYNKTTNNKDGQATDSSASAVKLVEYGGNSDAIVVWHNSDRLSLDSQSYALVLNPVRHYDHGEYTCLVNERRRPDAIINLIVQGTVLNSTQLLCDVTTSFSSERNLCLSTTTTLTKRRRTYSLHPSTTFL